MEYFDNITPGLREVLMEIHGREENPSLGEVVQLGQQHGVGSIEADQRKIWRALKKLTGGEARQIIMNVKEEDGYEAWYKLRNILNLG